MRISCSLALLTALLLCAPAQAQQAPGQPAASETQSDPLTRRRAEFINHMLVADVHLVPGTGLKAVHVGSYFEEVMALWGRPSRLEKGHLLGRDKWYYRADYFTEVRLDGKKRVEKMLFRGKPGSPYGTKRGATFGMPLFQIRAMYGGGHTGSDPSLLEYPKLGVSFRFAQGRLEGIEIYAPS